MVLKTIRGILIDYMGKSSKAIPTKHQHLYQGTTKWYNDVLWWRNHSVYIDHIYAIFIQCPDLPSACRSFPKGCESTWGNQEQDQISPWGQLHRINNDKSWSIISNHRGIHENYPLDINWYFENSVATWRHGMKAAFVAAFADDLEIGEPVGASPLFALHISVCTLPMTCSHCMICHGMSTL